MEGKKCDKTIDFAIKWWTDILSGKESARSFYEEMKDDLEEIKEGHEEAYTFLSQVMEQLDAEMEEERSEVYLNTEQVRRFEEQLRVQIKKSIEKDGYAYLHTDEYARANGVLGLATYYAGIRNEGNLEGEPSPFPDGVEMWIEPGKVEIRYDEEGMFSPIYQELSPEISEPSLSKETAELIQRKIDEGRGGK